MNLPMLASLVSQLMGSLGAYLTVAMLDFRGWDVDRWLVAFI